MQTQIKTQEEIQAMREGGKVLAGVLYELRNFIKPGVTGKQIDTFAENYIRDHGMIPGFKGYHGFPATICFCINDEVVHGIPGQQVIKEGDIVKEGQVILILEAMKMQNEIQAPVDGTVINVACEEGQAIEANVPLIVIEPESSDDED